MPYGVGVTTNLSKTINVIRGWASFFLTLIFQWSPIDLQPQSISMNIETTQISNILLATWSLSLSLMMFRENLPLLGLLVLLFALCHEACIAKEQSQNCNSSSSCGNLHNISYPFRLKGAPYQCGCDAESADGLELDCENNRASLLVDSVKFYVQEIDYDNQTIRLMDASLHKNTCSIPRLIQNINDFYSSYFYIYLFSYHYMYILNCTLPLNSTLYVDYVDVSHCIGNSFPAQTHFFYAYFGYLSARDLPKSCSIEGTVPTRIWNTTGLSVLEIQQELLRGYEFNWTYDCDHPNYSGNHWNYSGHHWNYSGHHSQNKKLKYNR